eukprot:scaffold32001_cov152-Isochrysis_galbana.AAC.1
MRCLRPCTPPVHLFSVYSLRVQPSIRQACNQGAVRRNRFTESLAVRLEVGCLGRLRACFKAVLKAHPTVYGWLDSVQCLSLLLNFPPTQRR